MNKQDAAKIERGRYAFTAVITPRGGYGLGKAVEDSAGYYPTEHNGYKSYDEADEAATAKNRERGMSDAEARTIVASSMGASNVKQRLAKLDELLELLTQDIYTDAPEYEERVERVKELVGQL